LACLDGLPLATPGAELALTCPISRFSLFLRRLFDEVAGSGLAEHPAQKAEMGKLLMHGAREFAK
jgi:hypothetical protein